MQYKQNYIKSVLIMVPALVLVGIFFHWLNTPATFTIYAKPSVINSKPLETPKPIPTDIVGYVEYKFGEHSGDALKVLECENKTLNPYAVCDNTLWGGKGQDRGYWQISNYYHPDVSDWCASDVKCSTDYAYRMWKNDGESFVRWTCGRTLGL